MTDARKLSALLRLGHVGLVKMDWGGQFRLTHEGRDFLDQIDLLRELDDRPGAAQDDGRLPARSPRTATPPRGTRQGDDGPAVRGARRQSSGRGG